MQERSGSFARFAALFFVMGVAAACTTKNGPGNGTSGSSSSGGSNGSSSSGSPRTVCEKSTTTTGICTCSTYVGNNGGADGYVCTPTCTDSISPNAHCCVQRDTGSSGISFCACSGVTCDATDTEVTDCRTGSADQAVSEGLGDPTFPGCP